MNIKTYICYLSVTETSIEGTNVFYHVSLCLSVVMFAVCILFQITSCIDNCLWDWQNMFFICNLYIMSLDCRNDSLKVIETALVLRFFYLLRYKHVTYKKIFYFYWVHVLFYTNVLIRSCKVEAVELQQTIFKFVWQSSCKPPVLNFVKNSLSGFTDES